MLSPDSTLLQISISQVHCYSLLLLVLVVLKSADSCETWSPFILSSIRVFQLCWKKVTLYWEFDTILSSVDQEHSTRGFSDDNTHCVCSPSISSGLEEYKDLFPRSETFQHIQEYCTGMVLLEKPSIQCTSQCFVDGPCQSSLNKAITASPWSGASVNQRRLGSIRQYHQNGFTVGIIDSCLFHHPKGQNIYGVYKYWDYVEGCYTYGMQLVTSAISTPIALSIRFILTTHRVSSWTRSSM